MTNKIYLDYNATTPVDTEVLNAMLPYFNEIYGNASSIHQFGREAHKAMDQSRQTIADFIGANPDEIIFTSGGTEADNFAIQGIASGNKQKGNHIITSATEHHAVLNPCKYLEKNGFQVTYLPVDKYGIVDPDTLRKAITDKTILVSILFANNETGTIQPITELTKITKERGVLFHTDAIQAYGKMPININSMNIDLMSVSGHKIYAPKGIGIFYVRKGTRIQPLIHGGSHEKNRRGGTENIPSIVGLAKATELAKTNMDTDSAKTKSLRDKLENGMLTKVENVYINGHLQNRLDNTSNMSIEFVEGESMLLNLDLKGIAVSSGSACTSGSLKPSHVLASMGVSTVLCQSSLRFSLGKFTTEKEIDYVLDTFPEIISRLRKMSPLYKK